MQLGIMFIVVCIYIVVMNKINWGLYWYNSVLCYPAGAFVSMKLTQGIRQVSIRKKVAIFITLLMIFGFLFLESRIISLMQIICALGFVGMCYFFTTLVVIKTRIFSWVGNHSFEFYLFHVVCVQSFCILIPISEYFYTFAVLIISAILVYMYDICQTRFQMKLCK